jgi:heptosyltransferase III
MRRLIIRPGAIGDCILSLPALEHLTANYTEVWVPSAVVLLIRFANIVRPLSSTGLDLVGVGDLPMPAQLAEKLRSFDSIVTWYGSSRPDFRDAVLATGVPCRFHAALPPANYPGHATDFFAEQVGAGFGLAPRIEIPPCAARDAIVIHPFSGSRRKNWPLQRFRDLASRLPCAVEWSAGPEEQLDSAVHFESLADVASWLQGARLYIGNDSGITHLAAASGVRTLALFGPTAPQTWAPRGKNVQVLHTNPLSELSVNQVLTAANRLLDSP